MATPAAIAAALHASIDEALEQLRAADEQRTRQHPGPGKWCAREVLGHLIDSACNNHRRFILGQSGTLARFDGYDADEWVGRQQYQDAPWRDLLALWAAYNRHLAHVIAAAPPGTLAHSAIAPEGDGQITLGFVMEDYVRHLRHHLEQIKALVRPSAPVQGELDR